MTITRPPFGPHAMPPDDDPDEVDHDLLIADDDAPDWIMPVVVFVALSIGLLLVILLTLFLTTAIVNEWHNLQTAID